MAYKNLTQKEINIFSQFVHKQGTTKVAKQLKMSSATVVKFRHKKLDRCMIRTYQKMVNASKLIDIAKKHVIPRSKRNKNMCGEISDLRRIDRLISQYSTRTQQRLIAYIYDKYKDQ